MRFPIAGEILFGPKILLISAAESGLELMGTPCSTGSLGLGAGVLFVLADLVRNEEGA